MTGTRPAMTSTGSPAASARRLADAARSRSAAGSIASSSAAARARRRAWAGPLANRDTVARSQARSVGPPLGRSGAVVAIAGTGGAGGTSKAGLFSTVTASA